MICRSPSTHKMSPWVKKVFLEFMPRVLCMKRPEYHPRYAFESDFTGNGNGGGNGGASGTEYGMGFGTGWVWKQYKVLINPIMVLIQVVWEQFLIGFLLWFQAKWDETVTTTVVLVQNPVWTNPDTWNPSRMTQEVGIALFLLYWLS